MLLLAETLKYSTTYKDQLILELNYMIKNEQKKKYELML